MPEVITAAEFDRRFRNLVLLAWNMPPVVGLGFLVYLQMLSSDQLLGILVTPLEPAFIVGWMLLALWYFTRLVRPVSRYLACAHPGPTEEQDYLRCVRRFPLHFWGVFVVYLLLAPASVIVSAERYTDYAATPLDWFRIHLVALVVSIIVGLPIFFRAMDLFGRTLRGMRLKRPVLSLKVKVLLLGALMPLMVDTMIVQYYWTRTGYFTAETFVVWLALELLAIAGSLLFVASLGQGLQPLQRVITQGLGGDGLQVDGLAPRSLDELGIIAAGYQRLLLSMRGQHRVLSASARLLQPDREGGMGGSVEGVLAACHEVVGGELMVLLLHRPDDDVLSVIAASDAPFREDGHLQLAVQGESPLARAFRSGRHVALDDVFAEPGEGPVLQGWRPVRSLLAVPLVSNGRSIGVLVSLQTDKVRHYGEDEVLLMERVAGEAASAVSTLRLLAERTRAQEAALKSEEQVRLLLDSTVEAIYGADPNGVCTIVNRACLDMLGYDSEDELLGRSIHELIHHSYPDGSHYPKQSCAVRLATLEGKSAHRSDEVHWRKDGTSIPVEYWSHPVYKEGELVGSVVTFIDISERQAAEQKLVRLNARNELLLESTSDGIIGVDTELRCTFANHAAAQLLGCSPDEVVGQDVYHLALDRDESDAPLRREAVPLYRAIVEQQPQHTDSAVLRQRDGDFVPVQYTANPIMEDGRVSGAVMVFRNIAEARAVARKMDYLASHDSLTGLFNRREFESHLEQTLATARRDHSEHALCYIDLDQFKVVNDTCGHEAGDELLRQIATLLHGCIRQHDMLARLGGDEFGMLLDCCPMGKALEIADQLRAAVEDYRFAWQDKTFSVGVSIGLVAVTAETESLSWALSAADTACYVAKDSGRNRVHRYELHDDELNRRRNEMQWVSRLNEALDKDMFVLRYQPIVAVAGTDDGWQAIEILVAMRDQDGSNIPPGAFIPAAERYNLMVAIDRWVVTRVFAWLRNNHQRLDKLQRCFINLSGQSVGQEKFLAFLEAEIGRGGFPPDMLCFEVTETAAVANLSRAVQFIKVLKAYGCHFALDDFGSGMSSFAYLKNLPLDYLKIDGNFVRDMVTDPIDRAMVQAIHQVGHVMQIATVAEFVEDEAILDELRTIGVDYAQGFGIARPRPLDSMFD